MPINYGQLLWIIEKRYRTKKAFCEAAAVDVKTLQNYINGKTPMPTSFILKACELLSIPKDEIGFYFFTPDAGKRTQKP